jgi:hypothetical protein
MRYFLTNYFIDVLLFLWNIRRNGLMTKILASVTLLCTLFMSTGAIKAQPLHKLAHAFLNSLPPTLRSEALYTLEDTERYNINYVPIARKGPTFHDFNEAQEAAALALLRACLSREGYRKTRDIMELEKVLLAIENNRKMPDGSPMRDPLNYHFCIFGVPDAEKFWGWRFEGHHVSLSFSSFDNRIVSSTPFFFGTNPAVVDMEDFEKRQVLKMEEDLGFALVNSLSAEQLKMARFSDTAPRDIITRNNREADNLEPGGIHFPDLGKTQQDILLRLLGVYMANYEEGFAESFMAKIQKAGIEKLSFAWAGSLKPGAGHYYRIQNPVVLIEYDNTQNNANHVHAVVRDLTNDFGRDVLQEHYHKDH